MDNPLIDTLWAAEIKRCNAEHRAPMTPEANFRRGAEAALAIQAQQPTPAEAAPGTAPTECSHRWLAYCCQDCGARAPCIIGQPDSEE